METTSGTKHGDFFLDLQACAYRLICTMNKNSLALAAAVAAAALYTPSASAKYSTPAAKPEELAAYSSGAIERRPTGIVTDLALAEAAKSTRVHETIMSQYRSLKARGEAIDAKLKETAKQGGGKETDRAGLFQTMSKPLHEQFLSKLSAELTPEQVETVKDKMTYGKVKFTFDGYCSIVPGLTDQDKAKIMEMLKAAREEAIDGGSAKEKSDIFQKYKDQINEYLNTHGHEVAKAYRDWNAKQDLAKKQQDGATNKQTPAPQ